MRKWTIVIFCALVLIMVSGTEGWAQAKPKKIPAERAEFLERAYVRTWAGVTENGGFDPYAVNPNPQSPLSREGLKEEKREAMAERERLHAEWAVKSDSPSRRDNLNRHSLREVESRDLPIQETPQTPEKLPEVGEIGMILTSWYGPGFQGNPTASGAKFDMNEISAAHKEWPLGTVVQLQNMENRRLIEVVITDRGPYYEERGLDLSYAAAKALGVVDEGVVWLEYKIISVPVS